MNQVQHQDLDLSAEADMVRDILVKDLAPHPAAADGACEKLHCEPLAPVSAMCAAVDARPKRVMRRREKPGSDWDPVQMEGCAILHQETLE